MTFCFHLTWDCEEFLLWVCVGKNILVLVVFVAPPAPLLVLSNLLSFVFLLARQKAINLACDRLPENDRLWSSVATVTYFIGAVRLF